MKRLYYDDATIKQFTATVQSCVADKGNRFFITLDQTAFYPEGGGQPYDTGRLGGVNVLEVHERGGQVVHTTDQPLASGIEVEGFLDWNRRFRYMQNHTGEHIFSGILNRKFGFDNVGFHMGSDAVTVDFNGVITEEQLKEVERETNQLIYENVPVAILHPSKEELESLAYRSKKELSGDVRIVEIPAGDTCACCGTHVERTGQIGMVKVIGMINYKGGVRISMLCGADALEDYEKRLRQVGDISHVLSAKADLIVPAVEKLRAESLEKDFLIGRLYQQIFEAKVAAMEPNEKMLCVFEEGMSPVQLRQYCTMLYEQGKGSVVAVCSLAGEAYQYALGSGSVDVRPLSKKLNEALKGRGGGSSMMVQGIWAAERSVIEEAINNL